MNTEDVSSVFSTLLANPAEMIFWMALTVLAGFIICSFGLQKGLERITKVMMSALLVLIVILAVHSFLLPGSKEGIEFYLMPNIQRAKDAGLGNIITSAMNQAFFTLSLGIGAYIYAASFSSDLQPLQPPCPALEISMQIYQQTNIHQLISVVTFSFPDNFINRIRLQCCKFHS